MPSADLKQLASSTRGQYYAARNSEQLRAIYETIAERIGASYSLVYESDRRLPDGTLRPVQDLPPGQPPGRRDGGIHPRHGGPGRRLVALVLAAPGRAFGPGDSAGLAPSPAARFACLICPHKKWRERMGIEPTRSLFPDPSPVLKTGPGTSRGHAPG